MNDLERLVALDEIRLSAVKPYGPRIMAQTDLVEDGELARFDVTDKHQVETVLAALSPEDNPIGVVVNNAGIAPAGLFLDQDDRVWDEVFAINVTAPAMLAKEAARIMVRQGSGKIINVASTSGSASNSRAVEYALGIS